MIINLEILPIIAKCWKKGYRFGKIKETLRKSDYPFYVNEKGISKMMHYIMDNGGREFWLSKLKEKKTE